MRKSGHDGSLSFLAWKRPAQKTAAALAWQCPVLAGVPSVLPAQPRAPASARPACHQNTSINSHVLIVQS